jgi:hypothetical protein
MDSILETNTSQTDKRKEILLDISNGDTSVIRGYMEYNQFDSQTPKNFLNGGCRFDIIVEPPTENADYWQVAVFGTRKAIDMLRTAVNRYDSASYNTILDMSRHTDRMFRGDEDNFVSELGFLSQLTSQSHRNHKFGFAHKTTGMPHSQEMMDYVYGDIERALYVAISEANLYLNSRIREGLDIVSHGGYYL